MTKADVAPTASFRTLLNGLHTRRSSDEMIGGGPLCDRADPLERLQSLRAELAVARQGVGL